MPEKACSSRFSFANKGLLDGFEGPALSATCSGVRKVPELPTCNLEIGCFRAVELIANTPFGRGCGQALQEGNLLGRACDLLEGGVDPGLKLALVLDLDRVEGAEHSEVPAALDCVLWTMCL